MVLKRVGIETPRLCAQMDALGAALSCFGFAATVWQVVRPTKALRSFQSFVDETCWNVWATTFACATLWSAFAFDCFLFAFTSRSLLVMLLEGSGVTYDHRMRSLTTTDTCQGFWVTYDHKVRSLTTTEPHIH